MLKWFKAMRPWSFTASIIPVAIGAALAWSQGYFEPLLFIITMIGGICLHACTNLLNTYGDFISGVDTAESAPTAPEIVTGVISAKAMRNAAFIPLGIAIILGLILVYYRGMTVAVFGLIGVLGTVCYTTGKYPYKYYGLGTLFVFFLMGPLMVLPAYFIQTGFLSLSAFFVSLPVAFLVASIMHSNDLRDIEFDTHAKIRTLAMSIGFEKGVIFHKTLLLGAVLSVIAMVLLKAAPLTALLPLLLAPLFIKTINALKHPIARSSVMALEGMAAQIHFLFGFLLFLGLVMAIFI